MNVKLLPLLCCVRERVILAEVLEAASRPDSKRRMIDWRVQERLHTHTHKRLMLSLYVREDRDLIWKLETRSGVSSVSYVYPYVCVCDLETQNKMRS